DPLLVRQMLSQLSYAPTYKCKELLELYSFQATKFILTYIAPAVNTFKQINVNFSVSFLQLSTISIL
ncbi:MAG: hypothetical protein RR022_05025, partial [Angelakisella sp.]